MKKEWFFDRYCGRQYAALLEDGRLTEFSVEDEKEGEIVGNIYKGKVTNVLSGMQAAFVCCGLARNCYLSMDETYTDYTKYDGTMSAPTSLNLKVGDEVIVQVTKPPRGNKGAKVTTHLSFVGKHLIYLPNTAFLGISRKITAEEDREKLLVTVDKMRQNGDEGFIVRTAALKQAKKTLKTESVYLKKLYAAMQEQAKTAKVGSLLYRDLDLPVRVVRDCSGEEIHAIHVGDQGLHKRLLALAKLRSDLPEKKIVLYTGERSMMKEYGVSELVRELTQSTVPLQNGGYLVIETTEAMTVVDVNTGSFVGTDSLEETVFAVNMEAAKEIARQVRLRNVGGIVVVDFIDMILPEHREAVTEALTASLADDKAKCHVLPMSEYCLTQFTRKRVGSEAAAMLVKPCDHCKAKGYTPSEIYLATVIRVAILDCFAEGYHAAIVELNEGIMRKILSEGLYREDVEGRWKNKRIYMVPHKTYSEQYFTVRGDNSGVLSLPNNAQILY